MRLIDADAINLKDVFIGESDFAKDIRKGAQELLDNAKTIEAEPVRHGHWTDEKVNINSWFAEYQYRCSVCGNRVITRDVLPRYCDGCGAKMDSEVSE